MAVRWTASVRYQLLTGMLSTLLICSTKRMDATNVTNNKGYDATVSTRTFCGWSVSVFSIVSAFPKHCGSSRTIYGYEVTCEKDMKSLPTTLPCPTVSLTYTNSWIKGDTLNKGDVAAFLNVTQLILDNNRIRFIARDVFEIMPYLKRLSLNHNPIAVKENIGVFSMLPQRLLELNLENITMKHEQTATFWLLFEDIPLFIAADEVSNLQNSSAFETQRPQITFAALNEIQLRNNRLDYIDMPVLKRAGLLKSLKRIDLSNNWLKHQALQNLLEAFIDDHKRKRASTTEPEKSVRYIEPTAVKLHIDLSSNRIRLINETTVKKFTKLLQIINQSATAKLNARTKERDQLQLSLSLKGNPFDCYCEIKPFVRFLFDDHGKTLLKNEQELTCSYPPLLKGVSFKELRDQQYLVCKEKLNADLSVMQRILTVIFSVVFCIVSLAVCYLNRHKIFQYWKVVRNCGEDEDMDSAVKWRNNLNKYAIPSDYKGIGHQGYHAEDELIFDKTNNENST
ncbi:unnamed protein product [Clavelina lepadiformis]|uniref:LRRCT domain-containing protein n=1 Tax=Clavelina lepadiformis TaxID=159417 RepID=A0ABP0EX83_CLALP